FNINVQMPPGTNLQTTDKAMRQIEGLLNQVPEVDGVFTSVGSGGFNAGQNIGSITVQLKERSQRQRSVFDVIAELRRGTARLPTVSAQYSVSNPLVGGPGGGLFIRIFGENLDTLQEVASTIEATAR